MQVQNWMTLEVISVDQDTSITKISQILKENNIRHLPVTSRGNLVGMITDEDVKEATPSMATTLTANELYHLLAETKAKDIMKSNPPTIKPDQTMEVAALKMLEHRVTGIPVVTQKGKLVGIISQGDVFKVLIAITGIYHGGVQFAFNLEDRSGSIREVADVMREWQGEIVSILSTSDTADEGYRHVFIRIKKIPEENLQKMIRKLEQNFMLLYVTEDPLKEI
ncbi:MAG: CBS domain-containing protein [Deltaproteobacteria bacterium]|nr:MAG: CBS domain-containing protein [Deltaproteobacteria bacterium]